MIALSALTLFLALCRVPFLFFGPSAGSVPVLPALLFVLALASASALTLVYAVGLFRVKRAAAIVPAAYALTAAAHIEGAVFGSGLWALPDAVLALAFVLAFIGSFTTMKNKPFMLVGPVLSLLYCSTRLLCYLIGPLRELTGLELGLSSAYTVLGLSAWTAFDTVLLLFGLRNRIPRVWPLPKGKMSRLKLSPDPAEAIEQLNEELALGTLTREEYDERRSEILNRM